VFKQDSITVKLDMIGKPNVITDRNVQVVKLIRGHPSLGKRVSLSREEIAVALIVTVSSTKDVFCQIFKLGLSNRMKG
jgi:hypothetical protein